MGGQGGVRGGGRGQGGVDPLVYLLVVFRACFVILFAVVRVLGGGARQVVQGGFFASSLSLSPRSWVSALLMAKVILALRVLWLLEVWLILFCHVRHCLSGFQACVHVACVLGAWRLLWRMQLVLSLVLS